MADPRSRGRDVRAGFKLDVPHIDDCHAQHDSDGLTFLVPDGSERRDQIGRRNGGGNSWFRFKCNDIRCSAVMLVRWDTLGRFVSGA